MGEACPRTGKSCLGGRFRWGRHQMTMSTTFNLTWINDSYDKSCPNLETVGLRHSISFVPDR